MAKVKKQDDDDAVRTFSDDTPDDEAMDDRRGRHSDEDDDTEPPLPPDPTKTVEYWKDKAYAAERAKTEIADGYKEKINQLQDEKRKVEAERYRPDNDGTDSAPAPRSRDNAERGVPPYTLIKYVEKPDAMGRKITVPMTIPSFNPERYPRMEDVPEIILIRWGAGDYKIRDSRGDIVGGFVVGGGMDSANGPPQQAPSPLSLGQFMVDPVQRALGLFDEATKRNDPKLAQMAADALQRALNAGPPTPAQGDQLTSALAVVTALIGAMNQVKTTFAANGLAGAPESSEIAMKRLEMEMADKKMAGAQNLIGGVMKEVKSALPDIVAALKKPDINPDEAAKAAERMANKAPGGGTPSFTPTYVPANNPATPTGIAAPRAPPTRSQGGVAPPGTKILCGGCGKAFDVDDFVNNHAPICGGKARAPPPPAGNPFADKPTDPTPTTPAPTAGGPTMTVQIPEDVKTYLGYAKTLTTYIVEWESGNKDANPEAIAGIVWLGTINQPDSRTKLLSLAEQGFDKLYQNPELVKVLKGLDSFPNFDQGQVGAFIMAATTAGIITPQEVATLTDVTDLAPAVDELRNHIKIQTSPKGREWFCRLLNSIAIRAGRAAPHIEFLPGGQTARGDGRDNL